MKFKTIEEHLGDAKSLVEKRGHIPSCSWLRKNGYQALYQMMRLKPEAFEQYPKTKSRYKSIEDWVKLAKKMADNNCGLLPDFSALTKRGFVRLVQQIMAHPEAYKNIKREKINKHRTPKDWVPIAEKLVKDNDGVLPSTYWLQSNGYKRLDDLIRLHPKLFFKINKKRSKVVS